jgi:pilus assembly protein Flp/PilA
MTQVQMLLLSAGRQIQRYCSDENGATAIEYAMIAAGVGTFVAAAIMGLGSKLKETFYDKLASLFP